MQEALERHLAEMAHANDQLQQDASFPTRLNLITAAPTATARAGYCKFEKLAGYAKRVKFTLEDRTAARKAAIMRTAENPAWHKA